MKLQEVFIRLLGFHHTSLIHFALFFHLLHHYFKVLRLAPYYVSIFNPHGHGSRGMVEVP
jgi:hypothetical protein